ncbi:hypothetical protein [Jejuia pallidilutea]|uniref:Uncharacterized protein n=1 Tax=Jejuia pallidilutea TaxID=504487 RepID=A0A098LSG3_9FLAO|nr:hypothetical protein [Jejuia pallidilutea]PQV44889.1 hypothetical protein CLV33_1166 [Jejuia pallidilutea]GAL89327.1 hypothetical protein JCM19538_1321 [Jejuia pallidilutea]
MRKLFILLFCICASSTYGQDKTCLDFKTGKFKYENPSYADWQINRTDSIQIETNTATGLVIHNDVNWISNCEFTLTCTKVSQPVYNNAVGKVFKVIITDTSNNGYSCILMPNEVQPNNMKFKMIKVD